MSLQVLPICAGLIDWFDARASTATDGPRPSFLVKPSDRTMLGWPLNELPLYSCTVLLLHFEKKKNYLCTICIFHNIFYVHADLRWKKKNNRLVVHVISSFSLPLNFFAPPFIFLSFSRLLIFIECPLRPRKHAPLFSNEIPAPRDYRHITCGFTVEREPRKS